MGRDIKFRVWDKVEERMYLWETINHWDKEGWDYFLDMLVSEKFEVMQYTGLKDKNGTEVYEGDIVTCTCGCPHRVEWVQEHGGTYSGGMPAFYLSGLNSGYAWTGEEEIIGSIYEHPHLLNQEERSNEK